MLYNGYFITIEGIDGCGKTVLAHSLAQALRNQGHNVVLTKEPGGSMLGTSLRNILQSPTEQLCPKAEFLLFAADRAQHFEYIVIPALKAGKIVISDRCADSSLAYQGYGRSLDIHMIAKVNEWAMQEVMPNLVFYVKVDIDTAQKRIAARNKTLTSFEKSTRDFWQRAVQGFEAIFATRHNVVTLDGTAPEQEVLAQALPHVIENLECRCLSC